MTAPMSRQDLIRDLAMRAPQSQQAAPDTLHSVLSSPTIPDSVQVALFGDNKSSDARHQLWDRIKELLHAYHENGIAGVANAPPPQPPLMRPKIENPNPPTP